MVTSTDDTGMRFLIALIAGPMMGWALGFFIRKSIKVIAFIGGMFFFIMGVSYYSKTVDNLTVLQKGVEDTLETIRFHEWRAAHGFLKFYKSRAEQIMKPINVETYRTRSLRGLFESNRIY